MLMIYGCTGYTGRLVVEEARARGLDFVLAGRDEAKVREMAGSGPWRAFPVEKADLNGISVLLNCAGPFRRTAGPMLDACVAAKAHYLDITGEGDVFAGVAARDAELRAAGICGLPGVGFDVVPSDSLAAHLARRLPGATSLTLALAGSGGLSHGTATTALEFFSGESQVRRSGRVEPAPLGQARDVTFSDKVRRCISAPLGDLVTAPPSFTEVETLLAVGKTAAALAPAARVASISLVRRALQAWVERRPAGPDEATRQRGWARVWGEARHPDGRSARAEMVVPEAYTFTAIAAVAIAARGASLPAGWHSPSSALGPDFILDLPGCSRQDLP